MKRATICPTCELDSSGNHEPGCPNRPTWPPAQTQQRGWICPVCGRGNAPWNPTCDCSGVDTTEPGTTITINSADDAKQLLNLEPVLRPGWWRYRYG